MSPKFGTNANVEKQRAQSFRRPICKRVLEGAGGFPSMRAYGLTAVGSGLGGELAPTDKRQDLL